MKKKRLRFLFFCIMVATILGITMLAAAFLRFIPDSIEGTFGPPDPQLGQSQRLIYSMMLYVRGESLHQLADQGTGEEIFIIQQGDTASQVTRHLFTQGYLPDEDIFNIYLKYKGIDRKIQAGIYSLPQNVTPLELAQIIHDTDPESVRFSFLPGWRVEEIAQLIPSSGFGFTREEFLDAISSPPQVLMELLPVEVDTLEGILLPTTYNLSRNSTVNEVIVEMAQSFFSQLPNDYEDRVKSNGLTLYEAIILSSIVQKEAVILDEAPLIASVFINRLRTGMPLQSDPTVQYALGYIHDQQSWWKNPLSSQDLQVESLFNTYLHDGLPPAPICNPAQEALLAVAYPAETDYLFFRSACDGSGLHTFSQTYEEHLAAACK